MQRWAAGVEYRGTAYSGWQVQSDAPSIQQAVEKALSSVANHTVQVVCAGRTDAGVHALGQVIHFDSEAPRSAHAWLLGANSRLPHSIAVGGLLDLSNSINCFTRLLKLAYHASMAALSLMTAHSIKSP